MKPDEATLKSLYLERGKSMAEIGRLYGVHKQQVRRWLLQASVPTRSISEGTRLSGRVGVQSEAHREALRKGAAKARAKITDESRAKQAAAMKGRTPPNKGKSWTPEQRAKNMAIYATPEYREKLAAAHRGEKSHLWRGGTTPEHSLSLKGWPWRRLRVEVYERDGYQCQDCKCKCLNTRDSKKYPKRKIQCHHIVSRRNGGGDGLENLVTLCMSCHHKRERQGS